MPLLSPAMLLILAVAPADTLPNRDGRRDALTAIRTDEPPAIDGRLDDAAWQAAVVVDGFAQRIPDWGQPGTERTELRVLHDAEALYVAVRAFTTDPSAIVAPLTRRDDTGGGDRVSVFIDSWHDRRTGFAFTVSAAGVQSDAYLFDDSGDDNSWDGVWEAATSRDATGWSVELRIPFSQLRFPSNRDTLTFGFNVARTVAARNEVMLWSLVPQGGAQFVSRFGELTGITAINARRGIELLPYVTGRQAGRSTPERPNPTGTGGLDLRMGVAGSLTLNAAFNPDFGQLDGDPATVNLSPNETFFEERRPFFTEASDAFRMPVATGGEEGLVYSRRIGRAPQLSPDDHGGSASVPGETTILGAMKLTGKTRSGWNVAALAARTAEEVATGISGEGRGFADVVEPGTSYGAARLGRDLRGGRTVLSGMATYVRRDLTPASATLLRRDALAVGGDLAHRWGPGEAYRLRASVVASRVAGSAEAIAATQRSPLRYYQRPDNRAATYDPTRTALSGTAVVLDVQRQAGDWRWYLGGSWRSPGFEINDLGFLRDADFVFTRARLARRWSNLGALSNTEVGVEYRYWGTSRFDRINHGFVLDGVTTLGNGWSVLNRTFIRFGGLDPRELRGGPAVRESGNVFSTVTVESDRSRKLSFESTLGRWHWYDGSVDGLEMGVSGLWRPVPSAELGVGVNYDRERWTPQLLGSAEVATGTGYLVADVDQRTVSATLRAGLTFSPTLSLQLWAEPFASSAAFSDPRRLGDPRAGALEERYVPVDHQRAEGRLDADLDGDGTTDLSLADPDFTSVSFRSNLVLRWEYRPSSTLFLVWQHNRDDQFATGRFRPGRAFGDLLDGRGENQLAIKLTYWWNVR